MLTVVAMAACWALASPLGSIPDEPAHTIYAGAVVRGDLGSGPQGDRVRVPDALANASGTTCPAFRPDVTADCIEAVGGSNTLVSAGTGAGRYPPLYYALVGWPTWFGFGDGTWYVMRLLSVVLLGLLLWAGACSWRRDSAPMAAGVLIAATPMTVFIAGSVNPNGPEIVSGIALALGVTGFVDRWRHDPESTNARHAVLAVAPGAYLALARPSSYLVLVALLGVLVLYALPDVWAMARRRRSVFLAPTGVLALAAGAAWIYARLSATAAVPMDTAPVTWRSALTTTMRLADDWLYETVGMFGWRDHAAPLQLQVTWIGLVAAVVVAAWFVAGWRQRLAMLALVVGATLVGPLFVFLTLFKDGVGYQARYAMALTQAIPVLGAAVLAGHTSSEVGRRVLAAVPGVTLALGTLALLGSMLRYAVGLPLQANPIKVLRDVTWVPPAWPLCLVLLALACWTSYLMRRRILSLPADVAPDLHAAHAIGD